MRKKELKPKELTTKEFKLENVTSKKKYKVLSPVMVRNVKQEIGVSIELDPVTGDLFVTKGLLEEDGDD